MKQALIGLGVFLALTGTCAAKGGHAMTQGEFRQVLHERDVAIARAWQQAEAADEEERRERSVWLAHECARLDKIAKAFLEAQSVLTEPTKVPEFDAMKANLERECCAVVGPGSTAAQAFIRHAWAAHRFNQAVK